MVAIHALLADASKVKRSTKIVSGGVSTVTLSNEPEVSRRIQLHAVAMQKRLREGRPIRDWDPLFAALFERHEAVKMIVTLTKQGVAVTETSDDPQVVALIRAHAAAVDGFVKEGMAGMHRMHPVPAAAKSGKDKFLGKGDGISTCPVTGEPVNKNVSAVVEGRRVFFCCEGCIATVKKNPRAYLKPIPKL
ncbi:MAG: hypothetical protein KIS66_03880 [Fimbriimonadaceae bacterium]|nr:hypothetical protein [Fimbriimonadaceae bacterium]